MDELISRQMPHSVEAEQAVLGSILIDERCIPQVVEHLRPADFYLRQNREIFETVCSMFNYSETIDPVTVLDKMKQTGVYDEATSYDYIRQLMVVSFTGHSFSFSAISKAAARSAASWARLAFSCCCMVLMFSAVAGTASFRGRRKFRA